MSRIVTPMVALAVVLSACGLRVGGDRVAHPGGSTTILRVDTVGGMVPAEFVFSRLPSFTLLGDGRLLRPGAVDAIYPGPALLPIDQRRLTEDGVQQLLREVLATGLFDADRSFPSTGVADAPDTVFTLHAGGRDVVVRVNALGMTGSGPAQADATARQALAHLAQRLSLPEEWLPAGAWRDDAWLPYGADAYRLLVRQADATEQEPTGIGFNLADWPGTADPSGGTPVAGGGRCLQVTGSQAAAWTAALPKANALTRWVVGARRYSVQPRPLLPGDPTECPRA